MSSPYASLNTSEALTGVAYTTENLHGVTVLVVVSCISLLAVSSLLATIALSAFNTRSSLDEHLFVRTDVAIYFVSLLLCDVLQALGSIFNAKWINTMGVTPGEFCTLQGVVKQTADVGTAFWTLIIAVHTFCLLVLQLRSRRFILWASLISGWSAIGAIVIAGPATGKKGPFFGISGFWCWISPIYGAERITLDYMMMFLSAFFSFILYSLVFLRIHGKLIVTDCGVRFLFASENRASWRGRELNDDRAMAIAKQMLIYPVAYTLLILPIAIVRFVSWAGHDVPFSVTIITDSIFLLSGTVNVILFFTTRRILPRQSLRIGKWSISRPRMGDLPAEVEGSDPYYNQSSLRYIVTEKAIEDILDERKDVRPPGKPYESDKSRLSEQSKDIQHSIPQPGRQLVVPESREHHSDTDVPRRSEESVYSDVELSSQARAQSYWSPDREHSRNHR